MVGKERMKVFGGEETPLDRCSSNTSPSLMVLMVHPDGASLEPVCTTTRS